MSFRKFPVYLLLLYAIAFGGCRNIDVRNKVLTVGKVGGWAGKNGRTHYTYFVNGIQFSGSGNFDERELKEGDMFLLYYDKANPHKTDKPNPDVKIFPMDFYDDSACMKGLGINLDDFRLVSAYGLAAP